MLAKLDIEEASRRIRTLDEDAMRQAAVRWDNLAKLPGSLGALETAVIRLAGIQRTAQPHIQKKRALVLCADNGVLQEGISPSAMEVTAAQAVNFARGGGTINAFARQCGAEVVAVDVGIATPYEESQVVRRVVRTGTDNMARGPAMSREECRKAVQTGIELAQQAAQDGMELVITGEMGIGNTTTSSAVAALLLNQPLERVTAKGAGSPERVAHKIAVLQQAFEVNHPDPADPLDVMSKVGGLDTAAMCGVYIGCASCGIAVMIDGVISSVAALCAARLVPACREYMFPSHCSAEPAGRLLLEALGFTPLITAGMCLGEGTGAALGACLLDAALAAYAEVVPLDAI